MKRTIQISTTNEIYGEQIDSHIGIVSSHVVAGANVFRDALASLSDIFGGQVTGYQSKLEDIKYSALEELKFKADLEGGDALVGVTIDVDEVSGGGKSMFMVTAMGTVVSLNKSSKAEIPHKGNASLNSVSANEMKTQLLLMQAKQKIGHKSYYLNNDTLLPILNCNHPEIVSFVIEQLATFYKDESQNSSYIPELAIEYFSSIEKSPFVVDAIYNAFLDYPESQSLLIIAKNNFLIDYIRIEKLLSNDNIFVRKSALKLIMMDKLKYEKEDIKSITTLLNSIEKNFKPFPTYSVKSIMGEKYVWKCICGKEVKAERDYCEHCLSNSYGFSKKDLTPEQVRINLSNRLLVLQTMFQHQN
ncbi:YbjQ family protein [Ferrimonas lipolytica]|uniref:UPF0145 protein HER31_15695 n=1 Tax=Ferrimonas lipolytica TaxID=2724191 RepID=A0A6H1UIS5_9GAMM|nr:YbjQ family protein [Ferrimonas lipolytica]QIZ78213.1 YbjQ family protein [Ferrimonas lipolytica]